jgi:Glycosyl transferase family 2
MRRRLRHAIDWRLRAVVERLDRVSADVARLQATLDELAPSIRAQTAPPEPDPALTAQLHVVQATLDQHIRPLLRTLAADEPGNRRRLYAARAAAGYERAWSDPEPLVSVTVATHDRPKLLTTRALPSILAQTYEHLEVVVVGDAADAAVADAVATLGDPRVRWANLSQRIELDPDPHRHWLVGSAMARNEATRRARGAWLLHFDDDDALQPDAIAVLLAHARESHAEVAYGGFVAHEPDGETRTHVTFPPTYGAFGWQGALHHAGLPFDRELVAAQLGLPGDFWLMDRMLRAGVRFSMVERPVWDYYPSRSFPV